MSILHQRMLDTCESITFFVCPSVERCLKSTSSVSFIDLSKRDLAACVGGGGEGHTSNANRLLNNSAKYSDNFLTVNLSIFKFLYTRLFSPPKSRKMCDPIVVTPFKECSPIIVNPSSRENGTKKYLPHPLSPHGHVRGPVKHSFRSMT